MQPGNKWTSPPDTPRNYMSNQLNYQNSSNSDYSHQSSSAHTTTILPGISSTPGLMSGSQPNTPRPGIISPPPDKLPSSPDLIRRRPPLPSRPASFTTSTFHSSPYPNNYPLRRRRTESSTYSMDIGPSFNETKQLLELWNLDQTNGYQIQLHAKMDRGFFRADQDWTCYRRNYFQVSATFDIHGTNYLLQGPEVPCLLRDENQEIHQIDYFTIGVSARITGSDKRIELVQHTPKRDKGPQMVPEPRILNAGGNLHLVSVGSNHNIVTFERLQFKTATANNGKRRAAQQYYEIIMDLYGNSSNGKAFKVASTISAPLVVRGRSPGHYADHHDRYRSMDAGQPSPTPTSLFGQSFTSNNSLPPPTNNTNNTHTNNSNNNNNDQPYNDFNHPYSSYHPTSNNYPYHSNTPGFLSRNEDDHHRENGYMMHPYNHSHDSYYTNQDKPYWSKDQPSSNDNNNNNNSRYNYEFNGYNNNHIRSMSTDNGSLH